MPELLREIIASHKRTEFDHADVHGNIARRVDAEVETVLIVVIEGPDDCRDAARQVFEKAEKGHTWELIRQRFDQMERARGSAGRRDKHADARFAETEREFTSSFLAVPGVIRIFDAELRGEDWTQTTPRLQAQLIRDVRRSVNH